MFGEQLYEENGDEFRGGFVDFKQAVATVILCMTGNWIMTMHMVARRYGPFVICYFIELVFMGEFMLINLFLSILLKNISSRDDSEFEVGDNVECLTTYLNEEGNDIPAWTFGTI